MEIGVTMTRNQALRVTELSTLYQEFATPFSTTDLMTPSCSVLLDKSSTYVPPPLLQHGSSICPPLKDFPVPDVAICYLPNVIVTQSGAVIYGEKHIIAESIEGGVADSGFTVVGDVPHADLSSAVDSDEVVLAISRNGTWNYSLFISEILPLAFIASLNAATSAFRVPVFFKPFMTPAAIELRKTLLESVGIARGRVFSPEASLTRYKGVVFIKANERYKNHRISQLMPYIAGRLKAIFTDCYAPVARRLYISRQKAPSRKVSNFDELSARVLQPFDLYPVELDHLGLKEQVDLFSKADLVLAEHGAGLVNTMFMRPGTVVIEMTPDPMVGRWMYRMIAHYGRLNYGFGAFETPPNWVWYKDDYTVPCKLYRHILDRA